MNAELNPIALSLEQLTVTGGTECSSVVEHTANVRSQVRFLPFRFHIVAEYVDAIVVA